MFMKIIFLYQSLTKLTMKKISILTFLLIVSTSIYSQDNNAKGNPRTEHPFGIKIGPSFNAYQLSYTFLHLKASYFLCHNIELEATGGITPMATVGANYHLNSISSESIFTPYAGAAFGVFDDHAVFSFPVGLNMVTPSGFSASIGLNNYLSLTNKNDNYNLMEPYIEFSIGWNFAK